MVGLRKLNLRVREDNYCAIKLYEELGFFQQGKLTREFMIGGEYIDALHMGLELD